MNNEIILEWGAPVPADASISEAVNIDEAKNGLSPANLSEGDRAAVAEFVKRIDLSDAGAIGMYGAEVQNKAAAFSDSVLKNVRTKDAGEAGRLLVNLVTEIKSFDAAANEKPGFFSGLKKSFEKMTASYNKAETNVSKISEALEGQKRSLQKDVAMLDEMYDNNYGYYRELTMYIIAGKEKIREQESLVIPALIARAGETRDEIDAQKLNDAQNSLVRFEKKIHDLSLTRMVLMQTAPQIRLIQSNNTQLIDKIQSSIVNSIPLWKNQIVISLSLANAKSALETQKKVSDMTNELLRKNSEMLKQGSLEIAEENERGIISIETIQKTNSDLVDTINGIIDIQRKGRKKRAEAEQQLAALENEFKNALLSGSGK